MAAGQPIEARTCEMEAAQQFDSAGTRIEQRLLGLVHFEKGEGGAATREAVTNERHRTLGAWQHLSICSCDFGNDRGPLGNEAVDLSFYLDPRDGDLCFSGLGFGVGTKNIAAVGGATAKRNRPADHDCDVVALAKMADADAGSRITDITSFSKPNPCPGGVPLGAEQREIRAALGIRWRRRERGESCVIEAVVGRPPPI